MGGSNYEHLLEEVQHLQHAMEDLVRANRELRLQLMDLRMGHGIVLDIAGKRFMLASDAIAAATDTDTQPKERATTATHKEVPSTRKTAALPAPNSLLEELETRATPITNSAPDIQIVAPLSSPDTPVEEEATFLEEIMYDEFANQMTSPISVWTGPTTTPSNAEEEKKAALRRELMGSFLLE